VFCRQAFYVLSLGLHFLKRKLGSQTKTGDMSALCYDSCTAANDAHGSAYSITSSAMASSPGGTLRPNALAVLRLITNSTV
jgi:hypothetical protein